jgi:carboxypeptidase PM20D1
MRKLLLALGGGTLLLVGFLLGRTALYGSARPGADAAPVVVVPESAAGRLAGALRIATVSHEDPGAFDGQAFGSLHAYLQAAFPKVHSELRRETVATHSLLYTWPGSQPSLEPILLMGHLDVVPVEPGTQNAWQEDPFGGRIVDGFVWGRGAIDNKSAVVGMLEAVEMLLAEGQRPARTVLLAFGHDEEAGGAAGAREIAALLRRRGVRLQMVLDEGGVIGDGVFPGLPGPVALVGVAEKGFASIELGVRTAGGHSSLPPRQSAVGILGAAIARLEANPMKARLGGPTRELLDRIGPGLPFARRLVLANLWLTGPVVTRQLEGHPTTNAMVRTTTAVTMFRAGTKDNVLPSHARAVANFRILPGDSVAGVVDHVRRVVDDSRVEVRVGGRFSAEPSPSSSTESESFRKLERAIQRSAPGVLVAPYLVVVATDARYFGDLSANVFRFLPVRLAPADIERMHGTNERVAVDQYEGAIRTYRQLLLDAAGS